MSGVKSIIAQSQANADANSSFNPNKPPKLGLFNRKGKLAAWQNQVNSYYIDKQNEYNSPANQRKRWEEGGYSAALAYGQGNSGNQSSAQSGAEYEPTDPLSIALNVLGFINNTAMQATQRQAISANTVKTQAQTETEKIKAAVLARNPLLDGTAFEAAINSVVTKAQQALADTQTSIFRSQIEEQNLTRSRRENRLGDLYDEKKIEASLNNLWQRFKLGEADQKIKAEILNSKEFLNEFNKLELEFIKSGDMNYGHWMAFIKLLLSKI